MKKGILNKSIPTIFGLLFLIGGIVAGIYFIQQKGLLETTGKKEYAPKKIKITNTADNQFTVSWTTDTQVNGYIKYGETPKLENTALDDRDQLNGEENNFYTHYVTVKNLTSSKTYFFKIGSGNSLYDNGGSSYQVILGPTLGSTGEASIISGKVLNSDNNPAYGAIVYLNSKNIAPLSTITDKEGRWAIYLNKARAADLSSFAVFDPEASILTIEVEAGIKNASAITITKNAFPVPDIILGQGPFDFREKYIAEMEPLQAEAKPTQESTGSSKLVVKEETASSENEVDLEQSDQNIEKQEQIQEQEESQEINEKLPSQFNLQPLASPPLIEDITITNPEFDGEQINTTKPEIRGRGPANKVLTIKIESPSTQTSTVTIDTNGFWSFTPSQSLDEGSHTIYINYVDNDGNSQELTRNFVVLAAELENLPAFAATPSASLTPSSSPAQSPSPYPSASVRTTIPSTDSGVPSTGVTLPTFAVLLVGIIFIAVGYLTTDIRKL